MYSVLTDVILSTFPWLIIRNLQMNRKEKIGVVVSMSLGILAGISAAVKTNILLNATKWTDATCTFPFFPFSPLPSPSQTNPHS